MVRVLLVGVAVLLAWSWSARPRPVHAQAPVEVADTDSGGVAISLSAAHSHVDGQQIVVEARNLAASDVSVSVVVQCGYGVTEVACDVLGQPDADHDGEHTETVALRRYLRAGQPNQVDCFARYTECALAVMIFGEGFGVVDVVIADLDFETPFFALEDGGSVVDGQVVRLTGVERLPDVIGRQCTGDLVSDDCAPEGGQLLAGFLRGDPLVVHARFHSPIDGRLVDCRVEQCTVRAFRLNGSDRFEMLPVAETPLTFGPAQNREPAVTITPSRNLDSPDEVVVTPLGFAQLEPGETLEILLCGGPRLLSFDQDRLAHCMARAVLEDPEEIATIRVSQRFAEVLLGPISDCSYQRCFVAAATMRQGAITSYALAELTFTTLRVSPDAGLVGGDTVSISARNLRTVAGAVVVPLQCGGSGTGTVCAVVGPADADGSADYQGDVRVRRYLEAGSTIVDCGASQCSVGVSVFDRSLAPVDGVEAPLEFAFLDIQLSASKDLQDGQSITVTVPPSDHPRIVLQCASSTTPGEGGCNVPPPHLVTSSLLRAGSTSIDVVVDANFYTPSPVDCRVEGCVIRVSRVAGFDGPVLLGETPISFAPEP